MTRLARKALRGLRRGGLPLKPSAPGRSGGSPGADAPKTPSSGRLRWQGALERWKELAPDGAAAKEGAALMLDDFPVFMGPPKGPPIGAPADMVSPPSALPPLEDTAVVAAVMPALEDTLSSAPFEAEVEDEAFFDEIAESRLAGAGFDAAWSAAADGDFRFLGLFLRLGRSLESRDSAGRTLLMAAAGGGQQVMLAFLLQIGADQTLEDDDGFTALHHAVSAGSYEVTATLLRHGADAAHAASDGPTPKELAAEAAAADRHADARRIAELFIAGPGGSSV